MSASSRWETILSVESACLSCEPLDKKGINPLYFRRESTAVRPTTASAFS